MPEADAAVDAELPGGLPQVVQDGGPVDDGPVPQPGPEGVAEREHIGVGPDPGVAEQAPGPAEVVAPLQDRVAPGRTALLQVIAGRDPGDTGADDEDIEMLDGHAFLTESGGGAVLSGPARRESPIVPRAAATGRARGGPRPDQGRPADGEPACPFASPCGSRVYREAAVRFGGRRLDPVFSIRCRSMASPTDYRGKGTGGRPRGADGAMTSVRPVAPAIDRWNPRG